MSSTRDLAGIVPNNLLRRTSIERAVYDDFSGGWRPDKPLSKLQPSELTDVLNLEYVPSGAVRKRGGMEQWTEVITDQDNGEFLFAPRVYTLADPLATAPQPLFRQLVLFFNASDGSIYYQEFGDLAEEFNTDGGADFVDSGHSLGNAGTGSSNYFRIWPVSVVTWNDDIYMTSLRYAGFSGGSGAGGTWQTQAGTQDSPSLPIRYDAQDVTFNRPLVHDLDGDTTGFPRARTCITYHSRIFAANVHKAGAYRYPSRVYWSDAGTAETWATNSWIEVAGDDGTEITRLLPFGEQILIFKNDSTWTLVGTDEDTFALYPLDRRVGTEGTYAADAAGGVAYFFDTNTTTIWQYDGARFDDIGQPISKYVREGINYNAASKVLVQVFGNYLWFSYPKRDATPTQGDENTETLVYDLRMKCWTRWDFGVPPRVCARWSDFTVEEPDAVVEGDSNPYFINNAAANDAFVTRGYMGETNTDADTLWTDYGSAYSFTFRTSWFSPDQGAERKRIRRFEALAQENSNNMTVTLYRDFINSAWTTFSFDPLEYSSEDILEYNLHQSYVDVQGQFNWLACHITSSHSDETQVNGIAYQWSVRGSKRGDQGGTGYGN